MEAALPLLEQPGACSFTVFDADVFANNNAHYLTPGVINGVEEQLTRQDLDEMDIFTNAGDTPFMVANTLGELAGKMGIDPQVFGETIDHYNQMCARGRDDDFFKKPEFLYPVAKAPFYAVRTYIQTDGGFGGILISEQLEAQSRDGGIIKGLYAAGDTTSGNFINDGSARKKPVINDLTWAFASGFIAGDSISEYLSRL